MFGLNAQKVAGRENLLTKDYHKFNRIIGNRPIDVKQVKKLVSLMMPQGEHSLKNYPIKVNEKLEVIDGQHRLQAAKQLNHYIYVDVQSGLGIEQVMGINGSRGKKWTTESFTNLHCERGNSNYITLENFANKYKIRVAYAQALLSGNSHDGGISNINQFQQGSFKVTSLNQAMTIMELVSKLEPYVPCSKKRGFIVAIQKLYYMPEFNFDRLLHQFKNKGLRMDVHTGSTREFLVDLERIYNHKCKLGRMHFLSA